MGFVLALVLAGLPSDELLRTAWCAPLMTPGIENAGALRLTFERSGSYRIVRAPRPAREFPKQQKFGDP